MHLAYPSPKKTLDNSHGPALQPRPSCPCWQCQGADDPAPSGLMPRMDGSGPCVGVARSDVKQKLCRRHRQT